MTAAGSGRVTSSSIFRRVIALSDNSHATRLVHAVLRASSYNPRRVVSRVFETVKIEAAVACVAHTLNPAQAHVAHQHNAVCMRFPRCVLRRLCEVDAASYQATAEPVFSNFLGI